jgi:regulator of sirC expression with transglutaminase-like and TPR domain
VDIEAYLSELDAMAFELRPRLRGSLTARVRMLARYLFQDMGFHGNAQNYYDPRNSYFNQVLDRRLGIPLTLSLLALAVGQRAGLCVQGVGLPGHFIARADDGEEMVLFDPFHEGRLLTPEDCELLVHEVTGQHFEATPEALAPASALAVAVRLLTNLKGIYLRTSEFARAARVISRLRLLLPDDPVQDRDLGATLLHAGRPGAALDQLEAYLTRVPAAEDRAAVEKLLCQARRELARWN